MAFVVDVVLSWWIPESSEWQFSRAWEESRYLPTSTHDSTSRVFQPQGFQPEALIIGQSTGMCIISGQVANWCKLTGWHIRRVHRIPLSRNTQYQTKEPDGYLSLRGRELPLIAFEAGWSEKKQDLIQDARLWLHGTCDLVTSLLGADIYQQVTIESSPRTTLDSAARA